MSSPSQFDIFDQFEDEPTVSEDSQFDIFDQFEDTPAENKSSQFDIFDTLEKEEPQEEAEFDVFDQLEKEERLSPFGKARKDVQKAGRELTENLYDQIDLDPEMATPEFGQFLERISDKEARFAESESRAAFESGEINEKQFDSVMKLEKVKGAVEFASNDALNKDLRKTVLGKMVEDGSITPELRKTLDVLIEEEPGLLLDELKGIASGLTFTLSELITGSPETSFGTIGSIAGTFLNLGSIASRIAKPLINLVKDAGPVAKTVLPSFFKITGWGIEGSTRQGIERLVRDKELPTAKELAVEGAKWAALAGVLETAGLALEFGGAVNRLAKEFRISRKEVLKRVVKGVEKRGRDFFKAPEIITPDEILDALQEVRVAEDAALLDQTPIDVVGEKIFTDVAKGEETLAEASADLKSTIQKAEKRLQALQNVKVVDPKNIEKFDKLPEEIKNATLFRGEGGPPKTDLVAEIGSVLGEGKYFAFKEIDAKEFGTNISTRKIEAKNPLIIQSDQDWRKWVKQNTTNKFPSPVSGLEETKKNVARINKAIREGNHDAVIIHWDNSGIGDVSPDGKDIKLLRDVFDVPQVFFPEGIPDLMTLGSQQEAIVNNASTIRLAEEQLAQTDTQKKQGKKPGGLSKEAEEDIVPEDREQITPKEQAIFQDAENDSFFVNALLKDNFAKKLEENWNRLGFNVERPFQQSGAPETGFRIKNYFSELAKKEEQTIAAIKKLKNFTKVQRGELALLAEKKQPPKDPELAKGWHVIRNFFDDTFKELQAAEVLKHPFPESYILRLKEENRLLRERASENITDKKEALEKISANNRLIKELENVNFVSIPVRLWFEEEFVNNPSGAVRAIRLINQRKRKTPTIIGMVEAGIIDIDQVDIAEIMSFYGRRTARDLGLSKIVNAAETEGLSSRTAKPGFIQYPPWQYPALKGRYLHPKFAEWLDTFVNPKKMGIFAKASSMVKGFKFYNPIILPFNDIVQQLMLTNIQGARYWKLAANDVLTKTPEFWEAFENGLFSQPFNIFFEDYQLQWQAALKENRTLPAKMRRWFIQEKGVNAVYRVSSNIAWSADRVIRMASYRHLLSTGMNPREAAQTAALFHGDYAMVHPNTRKFLNLPFFTPTFKIVMGKVYSEMLKSPVRIGRAIAEGKAPSGVDKRKFWGLLGTLGVIMAFDRLYTTGFGFEREQFGRKYSKKTTNDEGVEKDLTVNLSNPSTLALKFFWRIIESFDAGDTTVIFELIRKNRFELNPIVNLAVQFANNKKSVGGPIYESFGDDSLTKLKKSLVYASQEMFPLFRALSDDTFGDPEAQKKFQEELGVIISHIPGQFAYFGFSDEQKRLFKIKQVTDTFYKRAFQKARAGEEMSEKELKQYQKILEKLAG